MAREKRILVIDDELDFHSLFSRILSEEGYQVISAYSGEEATKRLMYEKFDLIILDLVLPRPGKSGLETLEEIRKIDTETCVIITSAHASTEQAAEAVMEKEAQTYIKKPFNIDNIRQIVKDGLRWRKSMFPAEDQEIRRAIDLRRQSIMKRCFLTGAPYCGWEIKPNDKSVFVAMPFKDTKIHRFSQVYEKSIKPAIGELNLSVWRADENMDNAVIMCKICQGIQNSRYAIIDISEWNPNVLFEFGLVCGLGKRAVLIKNRISDVPTDLRGLEYISYHDDYENLRIDLIGALNKMIERTVPQKHRR